MKAVPSPALLLLLLCTSLPVVLPAADVAADAKPLPAAAQPKEATLQLPKMQVTAERAKKIDKEIKRIDKNVPVVILTAKTDPADKFWATQSGADAFFNKPADPAVVVAKISSLLGAAP